MVIHTTTAMYDMSTPSPTVAHLRPTTEPLGDDEFFFFFGNDCQAKNKFTHRTEPRLLQGQIDSCRV